MFLSLFFLGLATGGFAQGNVKSEVTSILEFQQYDRAIHIMAMLILGFGFLMVFVSPYGDISPGKRCVTLIYCRKQPDSRRWQ